MSFNITGKVNNALVPDEVELTGINGREATYLGGDNSDDVIMRRGSVQPINGQQNGGGGATDLRHELSDTADGFEALSAESMAPLMSTNQYTVRKMAAQALMDVALMMANISQLRTLITAGADNMEYFYVLVVLVSFSLMAQVAFAILIFIIWIRESDHQQKEEYINTLRQVVDIKDGDVEGQKKARAERLRLSMVKRQEAYNESRVTNHMNYATTVLVFIITVTNMFITGFGIKLM